MRSVWPLLVWLVVLVAPHAGAVFDLYSLTRDPVTYDGYDTQCGYQAKCYGDYRCPNLQDLGELEKDALRKATLELQANDAISNNPLCLLTDDVDFDDDFFQTKATLPLELLGVRRTLTTQKVLESLVQKYGCCLVKNLLDGRCYSNVTLPCCKGTEEFSCDPYYPFRTYDGSCNNLQNPSWGKRGSALKHPFAPCYSDFVSKPALSKSGCPLPQNRKLVSELAQTLDKRTTAPTSDLNMFLVFLSEFVNSDMIGRANRRVQNATDGIRGCRSDGVDRSACVSTLTNPLLVRPDDKYYGPMGVRCLNFSPQEKANDKCELKHVAERNLESSYLDLSSMYGLHPNYDPSGKLNLLLCGATKQIVTAAPLTVQFVAIAGLFSQFHNYCVDRASTCLQSPGPVQERCRALTIGVYQKIVYEQLLPELFGDHLYNLCGLNCEYNPYVESAVSMTYKDATGRFQHVWIPNKMLYEKPGHSEWRPFNEFFHNRDSYDCNGIISGSLKTRIQIARLADASVNKFYSSDGVRGTCLPCLDLARNRDAGLCPLVTYKHFVEQLAGEESKCYKTFEDMDDIFRPDVLQFMAENYRCPGDVDLVFANMDRRFYPGAKLPMLVSQSTCLVFKRLKCTDRFFYSWNPNLGEGARHLINAFDVTSLLALFTDAVELPQNPFVVNGPRVLSSDVRSYLKTLDYLFCYL